MIRLHETSVAPVDGGHEFICHCGANSKVPGDRGNALVAAWDHEDAVARSTMRRARKARQRRS